MRTIKLDFKAKELCLGYSWTRGGFTVYYAGGIYIVSCFEFTEGFETIKEAKQRIKDYLKS